MVRAKWIISVAVGLVSVAGLISIGVSADDESSIALKAGPDAALTKARCSVCHSADYIVMDSVFLNGAGWAAEVNKMIKVMGAPISDDEATRIVAYLTQNYGAR